MANLYKTRTAEAQIDRLSRTFKSVLISGMRQVGKSTMLKRKAEPIRSYVTLDNYDALDLAIHSPGKFFKNYHRPIIIDEVQRAPDLFLSIKEELDNTDDVGSVWLSGSQRMSLMEGLRDTLPGRLVELQLLPLSIYERADQGLLQKPFLPNESPASILAPRSNDELWHWIWTGAFPGMTDFDKQSRNEWFNELVAAYIERDLKPSGNPEMLLAMRRFLTSIAVKTGQELRINQLAATAQIPLGTARRWLSSIEAAGLVYRLPPFASNKNKTLVKSPKLYMLDTGLVAYLCGINSAEEMRHHMNAGAFFETFVISEILKGWVHNSCRADFYFYRNASSQSEIDLIIHEGGKYYPIEIKMTAAPKRSMTQHFDELREIVGLDCLGTGALICTTEQPIIWSNGTVAHSIWNI